MNLPEIIFYPFFIKSILVSLWVSLVFSILGVFVLIKRMSFFSDGLAHSAVLGLALAFILNKDFFLFALFSGIFFSTLIYFLERKTKIHTDALIGLIFVFSLSLGLILISRKSGYQPELLNFFVGNILTLSNLDIILTLLLSSFILIFLIFNFRKINLALLDEIEAKLRGINVKFYEFLFYLILGITVVLGIKIAGIILVTAFLILPPTISALISKSFKGMVAFSIFFGFLNTFLGFILSSIYNLPISASIVTVGSFFFFLLFIFSLFQRKNL